MFSLRGFSRFNYRRMFSTMTYEQLQLKNGSKGSLWIEINRPELHNAFNPILISEITQ